MRRLYLTSLALLLSACQVGGAGLPSPRGSKAPAKSASARPSPQAPGAGLNSAAIAASPNLDLLKAPEGATERLTGTLRVDAAYMVAAGAGNVLSHNGAQIVAAGAGNMVAAGAGNMVAAGAGNMVAAGAGNIVAAGGGNIVAAGGLNLVAAGAGNMVAAGGGNYTLPDAAVPSPRFAIAQAAASPAAVPVIKAGVQLPAAGMLISIVSLATRKYLPMGVNAQGEPVYSVYSNAQGGYEAFVAPGEEQNLLVVANVPGQPDSRLIYNTFADRVDERQRDVDEDTAVGARYLRRCFTGRLTEILMETDIDRMVSIATNDPNLNDLVKPLIAPMFERFRTLAQAKGLGPGADKRVVQAFAREVVDATLSNMKLTEIEIDPLTARLWKGPPNTKALPILGKIMITLRERATAYMQNPADPTKYDARRFSPTFLVEVNNSAFPNPKTGLKIPLIDPNRKIDKPTDLNDFVIEEYLSVTRAELYRPIFNLLTWLQSDDETERSALLPANRELAGELESASASVVTAVVRALAEDPTAGDDASAASRAAERAAREFDAARSAAEDQAADR